MVHKGGRGVGGAPLAPSTAPDGGKCCIAGAVPPHCLRRALKGAEEDSRVCGHTCSVSTCCAENVLSPAKRSAAITKSRMFGDCV